jgi:hypothetical protein
MTDPPELKRLKKKWKEMAVAEEISVYGLLTGDNPNLDHEGPLQYEETRGIPRLIVATYEIRQHSKALSFLTLALVCLSSVLAVLTFALLVKG